MKTRAGRRRRASTRRRPPACAGSASRARCGCRDVLEVGERLPRARVDRSRGGLDREGEEELGRGLAAHPRCGRAAASASAPAGGARRPPRFGSLRAAQRAHARTGRASTRNGACCRSRAGRRARRAARARACRRSSGVRADAGARRPGRAACAAARRPVGGQRDGRRRRAPVADRPVRLRRASRAGPGDAAAVRRSLGAHLRRLRRRSPRSPTAGASGSSSTSSRRCSCTRCCSAAPTARAPKRRRGATPAEISRAPSRRASVAARSARQVRTPYWRACSRTDAHSITRTSPPRSPWCWR